MDVSWWNQSDDVYEIVKKRLSGPEQTMIQIKFNDDVQFRLSFLYECLEKLNPQKLNSLLKKKTSDNDNMPGLDLLDHYTRDEESTFILLNALILIGLIDTACLLYPRRLYFTQKQKMLTLSCSCLQVATLVLLLYFYKKR